MIDPWPATIRGSPLHKRSSGALFLSVYVFLYVIVFRGRGARRHGRGGGYKRLLSSERDGGGKGKGRGGGGLEPSEIVRMAQTDGLKMILVLAN